MSVLRAFRALHRTGVMREPLRAMLQFGLIVARHGPSLYAMTAWSAVRFPERVALVEPEGDTTFAQLVAHADRIAGALAARVRPGASVGLLGRNHRTFVAALLAGQRLGLRVVLLNTTLSARQTLDVAREQRLALIVADDEFLPGLRELHPDVPCCATSELRAARCAGACSVRLPRRGSIVILSSGTTQAPRAIQRRVWLPDVLPTVTALLEQLRLRAHAPVLLTIPLFHGHGLSSLALCLALGAPLHLFTRGGPEAYWQALTLADIEVLVVVPTVLHRMLETPRPRAALHLHAIVCGSGPLGAELTMRALSRFGPVLYNLYGSSECGLISLATPEHLLAAPGSVGYPLPGVQVRVRRVDGTPARAAETGEVMVRSAMCVPAAKRRGWAATGDLGALDARGLLTLSGRCDDLLVCGGENVAPEAVEVRVAQLPYVEECAVAGVSDDQYGQRVVVFVVLRPGAGHVTPAVVHEDLARLLPRTLRPARVTLVAALPRNAVGKLVRRALPDLD